MMHGPMNINNWLFALTLYMALVQFYCKVILPIPWHW